MLCPSGHMPSAKWQNEAPFFLSGQASMTRIQSLASPTKLASLPRAWRGIAALMLSLMLAPSAFANEPVAAASPSVQAVAAAPANGIVDPAAAPVVEQREDAAVVDDNSLGMANDLTDRKSVV